MPLPFSRSKKSISSSPEIFVQNQPLIYAQPSYALSERDSVISAPQPENTRPVHRAISSDVFADVTFYKEQKAKAKAAAAAKADAEATDKPEGLVNDSQIAEEQEARFERPATPPQGSRTIPWESYHDLEADHPVFLYPDEVREKMYKKGVDPVVKAMADRALLGKKYGDKLNLGKDFSRRGLRMINIFGTMGIGAM